MREGDHVSQRERKLVEQDTNTRLSVMHGLNEFLERDLDRELFDLPPLPTNASEGS